MKRREFIVFVACLLVSVFLIGLGLGLEAHDDGRAWGLIVSGLLINGIAHFFLWKKFWDLIKSLYK